MEGTLSGQVTLSDLNGWIPEMLPSPEKVKSVQSASINVAVEFLTIECSAGSCFGARVFCEKCAVACVIGLGEISREDLNFKI